MDALNRNQLEAIETWLDAGVQFTSAPPKADSGSSVWKAIELLQVSTALRRIETALGAIAFKKLYALPTEFHVRKEGEGGAGGGFGEPDFTTIHLYTSLTNPEDTIETVIHESGHVLDYRLAPSDAAARMELRTDGAKDDYAWWSVTAGSKGARGEGGIWECALGWRRTSEGWILPDSSDTVRIYSRKNPLEDFADTFAWYIEDRNGGTFDKDPVTPETDRIPDILRQQYIRQALATL
jgi:hypothetical protein